MLTFILKCDIDFKVILIKVWCRKVGVLYFHFVTHREKDESFGMWILALFDGQYNYF